MGLRRRSVRPRRRIFRTAASRRGSGAAGPALLFCLAAVGASAAVSMASLPIRLFGRAPPPPSHVAADAQSVAVIDGDTLRLQDHVVRLRGIDAPDRGNRCGAHADCGGAATLVLAGLVRNSRVECDLTGHDDVGRPLARCEANGTDLARAIVARGWARARPGAADLADLEQRARRERAGLWATLP